jgi:hypothetical protein
MTLIQTIVAPWGIWQCADYQLSRERKPFANWSHKTVSIRCADGGALVGYTGLGRFEANGPDIADWIAAQLEGHAKTVNQALHRINAAASRKDAFRSEHHTFAVGAVAQGQMWAAVITNLEPRVDWRKYPPRHSFTMDAVQVTDVPLVLTCGETRAISEADCDLLDTVAKKRPRRSRDFLALLAGVNRRASKNKKYGRVISEECTVSFMPPTVDGGFARTFPDDQDIPWSMAGVPRVTFGVDFTQMGRDLITHLEEEVANNKLKKPLTAA